MRLAMTWSSRLYVFVGDTLLLRSRLHYTHNVGLLYLHKSFICYMITGTPSSTMPKAFSRALHPTQARDPSPQIPQPIKSTTTTTKEPSVSRGNPHISARTQQKTDFQKQRKQTTNINNNCSESSTSIYNSHPPIKNTQ